MGYEMTTERQLYLSKRFRRLLPSLVLDGDYNPEHAIYVIHHAEGEIEDIEKILTVIGLTQKFYRHVGKEMFVCR